MPGAQYTDPFGYQHANAYLYESEYRAGQGACNLVRLDHRIEARNLHVGHPLPWSSNSHDFVRSVKDASRAVWVQHETGLEILAVAADLATLVGLALTLFHAYEAIRKKVTDNTKNNKSDRHYKEVSHVRVEYRRFKGGELQQELVLCQDVDTPFDADELVRMVKHLPRGD